MIYACDTSDFEISAVVGLTVYIKVDKVNTDYISFGAEYEDPNSAKYQMLEYEAKQAVCNFITTCD